MHSVYAINTYEAHASVIYAFIQKKYPPLKKRNVPLFIFNRKRGDKEREIEREIDR